MWRGNLTRHLKYECGKRPTLKCPVCPTKTTHRSSMKRHVQNRHPQYECYFTDDV